jgi:hypothetical protein
MKTVVISSQVSQVMTDPDVLTVEVDVNLSEGEASIPVISFDDYERYFLPYIAERTATLTGAARWRTSSGF